LTKIAIIGAPKTGKTTLGQKLADERGCVCRSTDEVMSLGWSESSLAVSHWFDEDTPIIEGVAVARALRKWLDRNPIGKPIDTLIVISNSPFEAPTPGQASMGKGIATVLAEIEPALRARGVSIERRDLREQGLEG
jgi:hypothetical protein